EATGSARSIEAFHMYDNVRECRDLMLAFGGHHMAAGMTIAAANLPTFAERINQQASLILQPKDFLPQLSIDAKVTVEEVTIDFIQTIEQMAPFGVGNPQPTVLVENAQVGSMSQVGKDRNHLKTEFIGESQKLQGIGFQL